MSTIAVVSPEVAEEMAAILGEDEARNVHYDESKYVSCQIKMSLPVPLTPKNVDVCMEGPCC